MNLPSDWVPWSESSTVTVVGSGHGRQVSFEPQSGRPSRHHASYVLRVGETDKTKHGREDTTIEISQNRPSFEFLNVALRQMGQLGRADLGGLLGFGSHDPSLEEAVSECRHPKREAAKVAKAAEGAGAAQLLALPASEETSTAVAAW